MIEMLFGLLAMITSFSLERWSRLSSRVLLVLNFLLNDAVIDCRFVLGERFAALLLKRLAQRLLAREGLPVICFQVCQESVALPAANLFNLPIEFRDLRDQLL